jgi:hypothetical protein
MTLTDFWDLIIRLECQGRDVSLLKVVAQNCELRGVENVDAALHRVLAFSERSLKQHGHGAFSNSAAADCLLTVAANLRPDRHGREDYSLRPVVIPHVHQG